MTTCFGNDSDTTIRITGLEAYANYYIELEKNGFDNVAWQLSKHTISVTIELNNFKLIEVPVAVVGKASGIVYYDGAKGKIGLGRVIVNSYNSDSVLVGRTVTEADGYFSFMGLAPGSYTVQIDAVQLQKLQMIASPALSFKILSTSEGDVAGELRFILRSVRSDH